MKNTLNYSPELENHFKRFHFEIVEEYEEELKNWKEQIRMETRHNKTIEKEMWNFAKKFDIVKEIKAMEKRDAKLLEEYLEEVRPQLINRPTKLSEDFKKASIQSAIYSETGAICIPPYAAILLVPDANLLKGIEGETGNPWVLPNDPRDIRIVAAHRGSGCGCGAFGRPFPIKYVVAFLFSPNKTAIWNLTALFGFNGFYILRADDKWNNNKDAEIHANVHFDVYQYHWHGRKTFKLLNIKDDNIQVYKIYEKGHFFDYKTVLKKDDFALIRIEIELQAVSRGSGSYSEINFREGSANYIKPFLLAAASV